MQLGSNGKLRFILLLTFSLMVIFKGDVDAETTSNSGVSIGLIGGRYYPFLHTLNNIIGDNQIAILQDPNFLIPRNPQLPADLRNIPVRKISGGVEYGVETRWDMNEDYSLLLNFTIWEGSTVGSDTIVMFTRSNVPARHVPRDARYTLSLNQAWFGWRYNIIKSATNNFHLNVNLLGFTLGYLTMDALIKVVSPELSFASISSTEAFAWSFSSKFGLGWEYYINKNVSIGIDGNYQLADMTKMKVSRVFSAGFPEVPPQPPESNPNSNVPRPQVLPKNGDKLTYCHIRAEENNDICIEKEKTKVNPPITIELDGYEMNLGLKFYF